MSPKMANLLMCEGRYIRAVSYTHLDVYKRQEALGKHFAADKYDFYSAGTETKPQINQDAVRLMKQLYGIDMEQTQYSKTIDQIPTPDMAISMGCDVGCPYIGRAFDDNWGLPDPTGQSDDVFIEVIEQIKHNISLLK